MHTNLHTLITLLLLSSTVHSLPQQANNNARRDPLTVPLKRRGGPMNKRNRTPEEWASIANNIKAKYGAGGTTSKEGKRAAATVSMTNQDADTSYFGTIQVGTPPTDYDIILDTGSADLWLTGQDCNSCSGPKFNPSSSSSFQSKPGSLTIQYGSGDVAGQLGQDTVSLGGFTVENQIIGVVDRMTTDLLGGSVAGIMGLAFQPLANSNAEPWWSAAIGKWDSPEMSFYFTRFRDDEFSGRQEPGGQLTLGGTNSSLYDGDINFIDNISRQYWMIPMTSVGLSNGQPISLSDSNQNAVIDTGTTLIGGPPDVLDQIYAQIQGSDRGSSLDPSLSDYYIIPCSTSVSVTLTFGGKSYTMNPEDLNAGQVSNTFCLGAFFRLSSNSGSFPIPGVVNTGPTWVVGNAFMKNVYTVFRSNPTSIGFASLKSTDANFGEIGLAGAVIGSDGTVNSPIVPGRRNSGVVVRSSGGTWLIVIAGFLAMSMVW